MNYKVIKPYTSYACVPPVTLPIGTMLRFWDERGFYVSDAIDNVCVKLEKWAVEAWVNYFEKVEDTQS